MILAKVGNKIITKGDIMEAMKRRHMSQRAGESLSKQQSFEKANFRKLLNELIDDKLMVLEAEKVELHQMRDVTIRLDTYILNLSLERLRQEEILDKVKVKDRDIKRYYKERLKKDMPSEIPSAEKQGIESIIFSEKVKDREKEYREYIKRKAKIEINQDVLDSLSLKKINNDIEKESVAYVNGKPIPADLFLKEWRSYAGGEEAKEALLDTLIVRKLLDQEALKRRYSREDELKEKIEKKRESLLIDSFKMRVVLPMVEVKESEVKEYYEANKDRFREPDHIRARLILLYSLEAAEEITRELKAGADFSLMAKKRSADPSSRRGGDVGWVSLANFPDDVRHIFLKAGDGDVVGPLSSENNFTIWKVLEKKMGFYKEIDEVRKDIDVVIGRKKFKAQLEEYLGNLRETMPVEIDEEELGKLQ